MNTEQIIEWLKIFGIKAALIAATVIIGILVIKLITAILNKILTRTGIDKAAGIFIKSLVKALLWLLIGFLAGYFIGIPITALAAIIGAATVAVGLALQGSLSNLASGILIAVTKPFLEGDFVELSDASGKVTEIRLFNTHLLTIDNKRIIIPNSTITNANIVNYTRQSERMLNLKISVSYSSDIDKVRGVLLEVAAQDKLILKERDILCELHEYSESGINFILRAWTKTENYWTVYWRIHREIIAALRDNAVEIPYKKVDVYLKN